VTRQQRRPEPRSATRRSFLRAVGAAATCLPFYQLLEDSVARAAGEALPLKFLAVSHPHGIAYEYWSMRNASAPAIMVEGTSLKGSDTETAFDIAYPNCSLQPLDDAATYGKSFKDRLLLIEGLDLAVDGHDAVAAILTGSPLGSGAPTGSSLDQFLSVEKGLGAATRKSNVVLCVGDQDTAAGRTLSYGPGGVPIGKIASPFEAFDYLFQGFAPSNDAAAQAALARRNQLGQSVVDYVREDCNRLRTRLAPAEQLKMDQHLASIRDLEKSFSAMSQAACNMLPTKPTKSDFKTDVTKLIRYNGGEPTFDEVSNYFVDLLAQAFACDITRFGTLVLTELPWDAQGNAQTDSLNLGLPADLHNNVAHKYISYGFDWEGKLSSQGDATSWLPLAKYNKYVYGKVARLLQKLDAMGAFDDTLVYVTSELGNPNLHSSASVPTLLAGGKNVPFKFGRRMQMASRCAPPNDSCKTHDAKYAANANNHLLVAIAQAFGVEVESFGKYPDPAFNTGALAGLS
jgi:Protein of unknown function (DUF1552)